MLVKPYFEQTWGFIEMIGNKSGTAKRLLITLLIAVAATAFSSKPVLAEQLVDIQEGTYYIKAVNGNAKGQVLYWNEKAEDQNISMMFESCGGSHADNEVWYITGNRNFADDGYYGIYLYKDYNPNIQYWKDKCKRIEIDNLTGRDQPNLTSTTGPHVFCGAFGNQDDAFRFYCQNDTNSYTNLIIESRDDQYRFFRHKDVKLFHHDVIYVKANTKHDTDDKLWELIPVNYIQGMSRTSPTVIAQNQNTREVTIKWENLKNVVEGNGFWESAVSIEIQYSTDKEFQEDHENFKREIISKDTVTQPNAETTLSLSETERAYYFRARLIDAEGVCSNWSKTVKLAKADASVTAAPTANTLTYNGSAQELVSAGTAEGGEMQYALGEDATTAPDDEWSYDTSIPTATDAGTYYVWYKVVGDDYHGDVEAQSLTVTIDKATPVVTAPVANALSYTGSAQELVTAGSVEGGEMWYALGDNAENAPSGMGAVTYVPTATEVGTYYVWYRVVGDENHVNLEAACVVATIAESVPATATLTFDLAGGALDGLTGTITQTAKVGDTITLPAAPTRKGYTFRCWRGSEYAAGAAYVVTGDHAFTAEWVANATNSSNSNNSTTTKASLPKTADPTPLAVMASLAAAGFACIVTGRRLRA